MEISGYEMIGFLGIAILTIEVAVYAIIVSLASRITRVTEEEIGDMTDMEYLLELMLKVDRPANREEIQEIRDKIKGELS